MKGTTSASEVNIVPFIPLQLKMKFEYHRYVIWNAVLNILKVHLVDLPILVDVKRIPSSQLKPAAFKGSLCSEFRILNRTPIQRCGTRNTAQASYLFKSGTRSPRCMHW